MAETERAQSSTGSDQGFDDGMMERLSLGGSETMLPFPHPQKPQKRRRRPWILLAHLASLALSFAMLVVGQTSLQTCKTDHAERCMEFKIGQRL